MRDKSSVILVVGAMFCFGTMALFTREANADILSIATWRAIIVAAVFGLWAMWREGGIKALAPTKEIVKIGTPYGLFLGLASSSFVGGYALTTVANTIFLHNLAPIVAFPLAYRMFRERTDSDAVAGSMIAILGVGLLSGVTLFHFSHYTDGRFLLGDFFAIISAVGYAGVLVWTKMTRRADLPMLGVLFYAWSVAAIALIVICLLFGSLEISGEAFLWTIGLAIVCTNIPFYLLSKGMQKIGAGLAALLSMTEVLFATAIGAIFYNEALAPVGWFGGALVAIGILYPFMNKSGGSRKALPAVSAAFLKARIGRAVMWLLLLNLFTIVGMQTGSTTAAWIAAAALLRIGADPLARLLEGRRIGVIRFLIVASGGVMIAMIGIYGLPPLMMNSVWIVLALIGLLLEVQLSKSEGDSGDPAKAIRLALGALIAAELLGIIDHNAANVMHWIALLTAAFSAAGSVMRGIHSKLFETEDFSDWAANKLSSKSIILLTSAIYCFGGIKVIESGHVGVLERFGEAQTILQPGLTFKMPPPIDSVKIIDMKGIRNIEIDDGSTPFLCGDQTLINVDARTEYVVNKPMAFAYSSQQVDDWVKAESRRALIDALRKQKHIDIITNQRNQISTTIANSVQEKLTKMNLGITINAIHLVEVKVPAPVQDAYLDVISAQEDSDASVKKAEAYHAKAIPIALGNSASLIQKAHSEATSIEKQAEIWTALFTAQQQGVQSNKSLTLDRIQGDAVAKDLRQPIVAPKSIRIWLDAPQRPNESKAK